ncbi:MAG: RluA family pseudouridine synthase [Prevotella sp.]|uniref:RluA family pseudouridine synthase n=1 Tax=Prevotella sp. TaxID=59823 RepID=UPI002A353D2F|nr:RluA family pseudouridine synthase [Prevotella sp.]MDD7318478.1 RluA family pseudouridine synthase [Prevotellaceae bacterium]MDY4020171.1 RluA family pseudouridine synthase [Prevotella sp.]
MKKIHPLETALLPPPRFTYPFCYEPHPLCEAAVAEVCRYIESHPGIKRDADRGKMFGVLVVETGRKDKRGMPEIGFLATFSGLLKGGNNRGWFVPPVYDAQQADGVFKTREKEISAVNRLIDSIEHNTETLRLRREFAERREEERRAVERHKAVMERSKRLRDMIRMQHNIEPEVRSQLIRESQFQKAELKRIQKAHAAIVARAEDALRGIEERLAALRRQRREMSDSLQRWLFSQYEMLNARGEVKNIVDIFSDFRGALPPAAAGDCCAPKLLQYAYGNGLHPLCMAEFWWGESPQSEIRHHLAYYPSCRSRCLPILSWMMQGLEVDPNPQENDVSRELPIVYEDNNMWVVDKPSGMLSVPGKIRRESVFDILKAKCSDDTEPLVVHRLDMETSGLLIFAKNAETQKCLQRQFEQRLVEKRYVALVSPVPKEHTGTVSLPMRPNPLDRPRQIIDRKNGREAVTHYNIIGIDGDKARIALYPVTGRTHQLRVHCAHRDGLAAPIVGDALYGLPGSRLMLHCERITINSTDGKRLKLVSRVPF